MNQGQIDLILNDLWKRGVEQMKEELGEGFMLVALKSAASSLKTWPSGPQFSSRGRAATPRSPILALVPMLTKLM